MESLPTENIEKKMHQLAIEDGGASSGGSGTGLTDPVLYLSRTFKYPRSLIAAMSDEGCVISGSRAQEFMLPGSIGDNSDWDFYVPGNARSATNMLSVLSKCGVEWKWLGDDLSELMTGDEGTMKVLRIEHISCMISWGLQTSTTFFSKLRHTRERIKAARDIMFFYRKSIVPADDTDPKGFIRVTKTDRGYAVEKLASPYKLDPDHNGEIDSGSISERPTVINGVVTRGGREEKVQLIVCEVFEKESRPLPLITNFYASHTQCFITGWCAVHLYYSLAKEKKSILWAQEPDAAVKGAITKYEARGYKFLPAPDPELAFPRERISATSKGALMVTFDKLYDEITGFAPEFKGEIEQYLQCRKGGLADISWFMSDDRKLVMNIYGDLKDLRKREPDEEAALERESKYRSFRMFKHLVSHAPQEVSGILRDPDVDYDASLNNKFTQALITSGVAPMNATRLWSFIL